MLSYVESHLRSLNMHYQIWPKRKSASRGATNTSPASPSLINLGTEILAIITDFLPLGDAKSMSMVHSALHKIAKYSSYRTLKLNISEEGFGITRARLAMMEKEGLLPAVRSLKIVATRKDFILRPKPQQPLSLSSISRALARSWASTSSSDRVACLCAFIPCMTGLRHIEWHDNSIPSAAVRTLEQCPGVKLSAGLSVSYGRTCDAADNILYSLQGCRELHALDVTVCYTEAEECLTVTRPLKDILLSCPNLRVLKLNIAMPQDGCVSYGEPPEYCGLSFTKGQRPPALEELNLVNYPFGHEPQDSAMASEMLPFFGSYHTNSLGYPEKGSEVDYWVDNFDWSRLQRLQSPNITFAMKVMPKLTSLKEIRFHHRLYAEKAGEFLLHVPASLEAISAQRLEDVTTEGILRHGSSLRRLTLHQTEHTKWCEDAIDDVSLREIRQGCPHMEELELDISRADDWPYHTLDVLASFPRLSNLVIWFEIGTLDRDDPVKPLVTFSDATMLFKYLHDRNLRLRNLTVHSGSPPGIGHGYPSALAFWPRYNSTAFECALSDRDDGAAQGKFTTTCTTVGDRENVWLRSMLKNKFKDKVEQAFNDFQKALPSGLGDRHRSEELKVAWKGPTPVGKWNAHY